VAPNAAMYASIQIEMQGADSVALYLVPVTKIDDRLSALQFCIYMVILGHSPNSAYKFNLACTSTVQIFIIKWEFTVGRHQTRV
jgi:hypothetical protein